MAYLQLRTFLYLQDSLDKQKSPRILETLRKFVRLYQVSYNICKKLVKHRNIYKGMS